MGLLGAHYDALKVVVAFPADVFKNRHGFKLFRLEFNSILL
jgi:hypothetical protein